MALRLTPQMLAASGML